MKKVCKNCRYFDPYWDETPDGKPILHDGDCHRYPPVFTAPPVDYNDFNGIGSLVSTGSWNVPHVGCMSSCGEWKKVKHAELES